ncbi:MULTISPECIES: DUF3826 domain-containing protein [unclassified Arcicella]|uniref:DUF3826 domain-containing protein n=1 Tax=unclassified Arcicella TaxID=2644986 RepID=UPI00285E057B|nr:MULTISPECIES: DUF3826 domain-containing protein [unclassified Arcicella]MDR6561974.1 hypothetical protein [Arcicella sp. BE51]MDR6811845.1 hypothetical protein [Arcicella sp. BE140]MDR6822875.1 hypothetical protein [Arcicella sp. BE139]
MERIGRKMMVLVMLIISTPTMLWAQDVQTKEQKDANYVKMITDRATKIVATLGLTNTDASIRVRDIISQQYSDLNQIHEARNLKLKLAKEIAKDDKVKSEADIKQAEAEANVAMDKLHGEYLKKLSKELSASQVEMVKDGMTYRVLPITYKGYQEMLPNLTNEQKTQILAYLTEAREHAMDAESSEKKHAWFGKYKGRINNYLSAAGIDMKKAGLEWEQRIAAAKASKQN